MVRVIFVLGLAAFAVWAALDVLQTRPAQVQILPKAVWLVVALTPLVGGLAWLTVGRAVTPTVRLPRPPQRPVAPDDDPDFLRGLGDNFRKPPE